MIQPHAGHTFNENSLSPVRIGKVDCVADSKLCEFFGIRGYPTLKWGAKKDWLAYAGAKTGLSYCLIDTRCIGSHHHGPLQPPDVDFADRWFHRRLD